MNWKNIFPWWNNKEYLNEIVTYVNDVLSGRAEYKHYECDGKKLDMVFSNPAMLKVIALQCDLFSLGKVYVYKDGKEIENDPYLTMMSNPNPFQHQSQFLWDIMFWNMIGNTYNYCESKVISDNNNLYILENNKIKFSEDMLKNRDKLILSKESRDNISKHDIRYIYSDGTTTHLNWGNIIHIPDLSNGTGNWFGGRSRIDALYKVITNSEDALDALNINIRYSGKFMVAGRTSIDDTTQLPMSEPEKQDIESKMNGRKNVHAVKSMIDIKRFVENIAALKLDDIYLSQYFIIGSMYGIPKDVLEAFNSGTYENQEKARGAFVSYCLQPKGNLFFEAHAKFFGYTEQGKSIVIDWEHLPFMQVFAKERAETDKIKSEALLNLMKAGVNLDDINKELDYNFKELDYESAQRTNQITTNQASSTN